MFLEGVSIGYERPWRRKPLPQDRAGRALQGDHTLKCVLEVLGSGTVFILPSEMLKGRPAKADLPFNAPRVGFEPTTLRLTAACSTAELPRSVLRNSGSGRKDRTILDAGQASLRPFQLQPGKRSLSRPGMPTDPVS